MHYVFSQTIRNVKHILIYDTKKNYVVHFLHINYYKANNFSGSYFIYKDLFKTVSLELF